MDFRPVVVLSVVLLLAGCGAPSFGSVSSPTDSETLTPLPVPTTGKASTPVERPPGVSDTFIDTNRLHQAHDAFLANRSYSWRLDYDIDGPAQDDSAFDRGFRRCVSVEGESFLIRQVEDSGTLSQSVFVDGSGGYLQVVEDDVTRRETLEDPETEHDYITSGRIIERFLAGINPSVTRIERRGTVYYRIYDRNGVPPALRRLETPVSNYSVTAYVTSEGFVRSMTAYFERLWEIGTERISLRFNYNSVGSTNVERPSWVASLLPQTPTPASLTGTADPTIQANCTAAEAAQTTRCVN